MKLSLYLCIIFIIILESLIYASALANHVSPEIRTQVNQPTDLFDKSLGDTQSVKKKLDADIQAGINSLGNGNSGSTPQGMNLLTELNAKDLENNSSKLNSIKANDLNIKGREELVKTDSLSELYTDYNSPLNKRHLEDAKLISGAQDLLLGDLIGKLKELDVDCKTVKGDKIHEPEYYLQINTSNHKDTIYNQTFCEELRGQYNCNDSVTIHCIKRVMQYQPWQNQELTYTGTEIHNEHEDWFEWVYWKSASRSSNKHKAELKYSAADSIRAHIAQKINVTLEQVELLHQNNPPTTLDIFGMMLGKDSSGGIGFERPGRGNIGLMEWPQDRFRMYISYSIPYRTRPQGVEICEQWSEIWNERCVLK